MQIFGKKIPYKISVIGLSNSLCDLTLLLLIIGILYLVLKYSMVNVYVNKDGISLE